MHKHYPIRSLNSWRTGDTVKYFSEPTSIQDLLNIYAQHKEERTILLGLGSNILFPDGELDAHIIRTTKALSNTRITGDMVVADAGVPLAKLAKLGSKHGFKQAAFLATIPGTVGGALQMNAGAYGHEMWDYVESVEVLTSTGIKTLLKKDCQPSYRSVKLPIDIVMFLSVSLKFCRECPIASKQQIKHYLSHRNQSQPVGTFNCGSVFRNPPGDSAGRMIDRLGLLGHQIGYARVSPKHGNFIENVQMKASCKDITTLIIELKDRVFAQYGVSLALEVKVYE